ncbi:signal peptidase I [Brevundimonas naejangsanensis]|uniref:signal peptidase I n=1 Tax=Brevundimonas naejangsanensis TaxID=588932 RepID=UPI003D09256E
MSAVTSRWGRVGIAAALLVAALGYKGGEALLTRYRIGFNATTSLNDWGYVIDRNNRAPRRGDLVEFVVPDNDYYPAGASFVKRVAGVPGDLVERRGDEVFVAGAKVGKVKAHDSQGRPAAPGPLGVIPQGHFFVAGEHVDSLDSRYAIVGFIENRRIRGVGEPIL